MGFNKRFLSKNHIIQNIDWIMKYLDADAVYTTDEFSREVYRMFNQGKTEEETTHNITEVKITLMKPLKLLMLGI